jgi:hypothetical protein
MRKDRPGPVKQDDASYYHSRVVQEQTAAANATCEAARRCHDELAIHYLSRENMLRFRRDNPDGAPAAPAVLTMA